MSTTNINIGTEKVQRLTSADQDLQSDIDAIGSISIVPSLLEVICTTTGMGFAAVARVTEGRWMACGVRDQINFGLKPGDELEVETTICHEIRQTGVEVAIDHVARDPRFCDHQTPKMYGFQSYISVPIIRRNGELFGTLCAIDPLPHKLNNARTIDLFRLFADLISFHLDNAERAAASEAKLQEERSVTELREQFIAILGHDLRNPVSAISNSAQLQMRLSPDEDMLQLAAIIKIQVSPLKWRRRLITACLPYQWRMPARRSLPPCCNGIFQPFTRGDIIPGKQELGLGLYIAAEIARAHSGRLEVDSSPLETRLTLSIPCS